MKELLKEFLNNLLVLLFILNISTVFHSFKFSHFYYAREIFIKNMADKRGLDITKAILFGINNTKPRKDNIKIERMPVPSLLQRGKHGAGVSAKDTNFSCYNLRDDGKMEITQKSAHLSLCENESAKCFLERQNILVS